MGKRKPVLGLVGLCFGLALSGCKGDGCCGWLFSRKEQANPAVARVNKTSDDGQVVRTRTVPDRSVSNRDITTLPTEEAKRTKKVHDYDPKEYSAPAQTTDLVESANKVLTPPGKEEKSQKYVPSDPNELNGPYEVKAVAEKKTVAAPAAETVIPPQPLSQGEMPTGSNTVPADATRIDPPTMFRTTVPGKMPEGDKAIPELKPVGKEMKGVETIPAPVMEKPIESPVPAAPAVKPAPIEIPSASGPMTDPTPPGAMMAPPPGAPPSSLPSLPTPPPIPEVKGAAMPPPPVEPVGGMELPLSPPPPMPGK